MKPSTWMEASPRFSTWIGSVVTTLQFCRDCFTQYRDMKAMDPLNFLESCLLVILANSALRNTWQLFIRKWSRPYLETWSSTSKSSLEATQGVNFMESSWAGQGHLVASLAGLLTRPSTESI